MFAEKSKMDPAQYYVYLTQYCTEQLQHQNSYYISPKPHTLLCPQDAITKLWESHLSSPVYYGEMGGHPNSYNYLKRCHKFVVPQNAATKFGCTPRGSMPAFTPTGRLWISLIPSSQINNCRKPNKNLSISKQKENIINPTIKYRQPSIYIQPSISFPKKASKNLLPYSTRPIWYEQNFIL
jgi:hypothetical protein